MPSKTALTTDQWYQKILSTFPPWFLEDASNSTLRSHLYGTAAVYSAIEADCYALVDETYIGRASEEMLEAHASERVIPELGYSGAARARQIKEMWSRLTKAQLSQAINDLLQTPAEIEEGFSGVGYSMLDLDWLDAPENVISWDELKSFFNVVIEEQPSTIFAYMDRESYVGSSFVGYTAEEATANLAKIVKKAIEYYKASGVRFRISKKD